MVEVTNTGEGRALAVEGNGINVISDAERTGRPADLFWPWFGANVSVLGLSYGAFTLGFGISFWQAVVAGVVGILFSFLLCGVVAPALRCRRAGRQARLGADDGALPRCRAAPWSR